MVEAFLIRKLVNLKYKDNCFVKEHLNEIKYLVSQLLSMDITYDPVHFLTVGKCL